MPVGELISSLEPGHPLLALATRVSRCESGQSWTWDGVRFELLRPPASDYERVMKTNAMSCVLRVVGGTRSALLTGDIEHEQEMALVARHGAALHSELLIVPHHGSKTSSTEAFVDAVRPEVAVVQAGYRSRFGHPAPAVMARYRERVIEVHVSPSCGAWRWMSDESAPSSCERDLHGRYWHHHALP